MSTQPRSSRSLRTGLAALAVGVIVVGAVGLAVSLLLGQGRVGSEPGSTLVEMHGDGNAVSERFDARPGWSIAWENSGQYFSYTIHGDVEFGQVITQNGPGSGVTTPVPSGNFFIEVVAQGPWSITVTQGD
jgi:hypothetical protein